METQWSWAATVARRRFGLKDDDGYKGCATIPYPLRKGTIWGGHLLAVASLLLE
ncbi:hypothetical protein TIFTF001_030075 [Ficus carica]|uniref:Uncharacterized protein n=1 Tax=Ficus carica TaxID=3494 RepID=A0AA88DT10_FICCA|nr:hypothetical protein TIFTF001_030075 [Ficus carica]